MKTAPSTKLHEVYDARVKAIVYAGSRTACNKFWVQRPAEIRHSLVVRVAGK